MRQSRWPTRIANTLGTLGYLSCGIQWVWATIILCYPIISDENSFLFRRDAPQIIASTPTPPPLSPAVGTVLIIATAALLVFTVITLIRLPKAVGKTGAKITQTTSAALLPTLTRHKKLSKQRRITLSYHVTLFIKLVITFLPLVILFLAPAIAALPQNVILAVATFCFIWTTVAFSLQAVAVKLLKLRKSDAW